MAALTFDTLKFAERLKSGGMPPAQAIAEAEALRDVLSESMDTTVATKTDIAEVKAEISRLDSKFEMKLSQLESKIDLKFGLVDARFDKVNWMLGVIIALATASFARQFL